MDTTARTKGWVRGLALALGTIAGIGALTLASGRADFAVWLVDLRAIPPWAAALVLAVASASLATWACTGRAARPAAGMAAALALVAAANAGVVAALHARGTIGGGMPVPLSALVAAGFGAIAWAAARARGVAPRRLAWTGAAWALVFLAAFPVFQVEWFGRTHYARTADWAVVPGARVYADGTLCPSLEDRVQSAVALHRAGVVRRLLMSGGPGPGGMHETEAMRLRAMALGVPAGDILVDRGGVNTAATAANVARMARESGTSPRVVVVSEFYHLPRLKMAFARAGLEARTEPATPGHWLGHVQVPGIVREVPAFWFYALRPGRAFESRG